MPGFAGTRIEDVADTPAHLRSVGRPVPAVTHGCLGLRTVGQAIARAPGAPRRAGISTSAVYAYFDSKNAIYDAMFGKAASQFADRIHCRPTRAARTPGSRTTRTKGSPA